MHFMHHNFQSCLSSFEIDFTYLKVRFYLSKKSLFVSKNLNLNLNFPKFVLVFFKKMKGILQAFSEGQKSILVYISSTCSVTL